MNRVVQLTILWSFSVFFPSTSTYRTFPVPSLFTSSKLLSLVNFGISATSGESESANCCNAERTEDFRDGRVELCGTWMKMPSLWVFTMSWISVGGAWKSFKVIKGSICRVEAVWSAVNESLR